MTREEIAHVVREVMREEKRVHAENMDDALLKTVSAILTSFGIPDDERKDIAEDFRYLRRWRLGAERVNGVAMKAVITILVGGLLSAIGLGVKAMLGK